MIFWKSAFVGLEGLATAETAGIVATFCGGVKEEDLGGKTGLLSELPGTAPPVCLEVGVDCTASGDFGISRQENGLSMTGESMLSRRGACFQAGIGDIQGLSSSDREPGEPE